MRVGIYNEPMGGGIGGSEVSVAVLAEALSSSSEVEIVHHLPDLSQEKLSELSGTDLSGVRLRYVQPEPYSWGISTNPKLRYRHARNWHAELSSPYSVFINFTHHTPPFCHAAKGILVVLFPLDERPSLQISGDLGRAGRLQEWKTAKRLYHEWEWRRRLGSYQIKLVNSDFSRIWTKRRWAVEAQIVHPPVDVDFGVREKANIILSVGRFTIQGHSKKQMEMVRAFQKVKQDGLDGWQYFSVGGLGTSQADRAYFEDVRREAERCQAEVVANIAFPRLRELYEQAMIFWHAAGFGEDEKHPELCEHFGIATVEAMAAGCVPVVINKGGQREIVQHGVNGFLWNTLEELARYTLLLAGDSNLRARMGEAARERARMFHRRKFVEAFLRTTSLSP